MGKRYNFTYQGMAISGVGKYVSYEDYQELEAQNRRLKSAIKWALGMNGRFAVRKDGQGAFWWRTELRTRAGFKGEGDEDNSK